MRIISGSSQPVSELAAFIELAKDPKAFEEKLRQLEDAKAASAQAAADAAAAEERARQEQARAAAVIDEANAIMAGAKKGQADLSAEKDALAEAKRTFLQVSRAKADEQGARSAAIEERERAIERREVALRAREEKLGADEAKAKALIEEYEAKLAGLKKLVA